jgi:hypothetical protein
MAYMALARSADAHSFLSLSLFAVCFEEQTDVLAAPVALWLIEAEPIIHFENKIFITNYYDYEGLSNYVRPHVHDINTLRKPNALFSFFADDN